MIQLPWAGDCANLIILPNGHGYDDAREFLPVRAASEWHGQMSGIPPNPRIVGGTVDIGAYEYQTPVSKISYAWLQQYGLPITTNIDSSDLDGTSFSVYQDWIAGLNPTNAQSVLRMVSVVPQGTNVAVTWQSVAGINYFLECSTNLSVSQCFTCVATNLAGQPNLTTFVHTNAACVGSRFYRVGVGN